MAAPPLPPVLDLFGERWPYGVEPTVKILVDPDKMSASDDVWVIHQLVAPRFFATRLKDATHVLLDPDVPVTALKLAQYAAYDQHALSFDWAIDGARGRIGDGAEHDYKMRTPVVQPSVKNEPAVGDKMVGPSAKGGDVERVRSRQEPAVRVDQPMQQEGHPKASQLTPPPTSVAGREPVARGSTSVMPAASLASSQFSARPSALATEAVPRPLRSSSLNFAPASLARPPFPHADAATLEQPGTSNGHEDAELSSESEHHRPNKNALKKESGPAPSPAEERPAASSKDAIFRARQSMHEVMQSAIKINSGLSPSASWFGLKRQQPFVNAFASGSRPLSLVGADVPPFQRFAQSTSSSFPPPGPAPWTPVAARRQREVQESTFSLASSSGVPSPSSPIVGHQPNKDVQTSPGRRLKKPASDGTRGEDLLDFFAPKPRSSRPLSQPKPPSSSRAATSLGISSGASSNETRVESSACSSSGASSKESSQSYEDWWDVLVSSRPDASEEAEESESDEEDSMSPFPPVESIFSQLSKRKQSVEREDDAQDDSGQSAAKRRKPAPPKKRKKTKAEQKAERAERARKRKEKAAEDKAATALLSLGAEADASVLSD